MSNSGTHFNNRHGGDAHYGGVRVRDTHGPSGVSPAIMGQSWSESRDGEQSQKHDIAPRAVDGSVHIIPGTIDLDLFAETIVPPRVLDALPSLPDDDFPQGSLVFLTTDEKLYRNTDGSTWSVEVDGEDIIANSITAGQIAAGAIGTTELAADAVIANVLNVGGTVQINDDGITILDGAITLADYSGQSVLGAAGFYGSWRSFIESGGIFNADFRGATAGALSESLVGAAATDADYEASLSDDLPYWVIEDTDANALLEVVTASEPPSGRAVRFTSAGGGVTREAKFFQDVPVRSGSYISVAVMGSLDAAGSPAGFTNQIGVISAPVDAKYVRLILTLTEEPDSDTYLTLSVRFRSETHAYLSSYGEVDIITNAFYNTAGIIYLASIAINSQTFSPTIEGSNNVYVDLGADGDLIYLGTAGTVELPGGVLLLDDVTIERPSAGKIQIGGDLDVVGTLTISDGELMGWGDIAFERISGTVMELTTSGEELHSAGEAWISPSLGNSWVNFGGSLDTCQYRKDALGFVHLKGVIKSGTLGLQAFQLPAGYRPGGDLRFACVSNNAFGGCNVSSAGAVVPNVGSNVSFSLDTVMFRAEN